jgi:hypothetical protein
MRKVGAHSLTRTRNYHEQHGNAITEWLFHALLAASWLTSSHRLRIERQTF